MNNNPRVFRGFFHHFDGLVPTPPSYSPKGIVPRKDFSEIVFHQYWGSDPTGRRGDLAWPVFLGVLETYSAQQLRNPKLRVDWDAVSKQLSTSTRPPRLPSSHSMDMSLADFYRHEVHKLVVAWLDEVDCQARLQSRAVAVLDATFSNLYTLDPTTLKYRPRRIGSADRWNIFQLMSLVAKPSTFDAKPFIKATAVFSLPEWIRYIAKSRQLRGIARDLPHSAAHCLLQSARDAFAADPRSNTMLVKLLQDVAFYTNTFPKFAQVNATMSNAQVRSQGNEARLWSAVLRGSSVLVKKTKHNSDLTKGQFCELRKRQVREIMAWWCLSESRVENIVPLLGACQEDQDRGRQFFPVMPVHLPAKEYMEGLIHGGIYDMDRREPLAAIFLGAANGVRVLHDLDIVHGDLHWRNILIRRPQQSRTLHRADILLCDFGMLRVQHKELNTTSVKPYSSQYAPFAPPEILNPTAEMRPEKSGDIFSLGKIVCAFVEMREPRPGPVESGHPRALESFMTYRQSYKLWKEVTSMTKAKAAARPSIKDVQRELIERFR